MTRYSNQWTALSVWAVAIGGAWAVMVPSVLSASTLLVVAAGGPATLILIRTLRLAHDPSPSFGQQLAVLEAVPAAAPVQE
jgi:hypothetical protein